MTNVTAPATGLFAKYGVAPTGTSNAWGSTQSYWSTETTSKGLFDVLTDVVNRTNTYYFVPTGTFFTEAWPTTDYLGNTFSSLLPAMGAGGVVSQPTALVAGERGKEAIVPLENSEFMQEIRAMRQSNERLEREFKRQNDRLIMLKRTGAVLA
jgi:hypothetical protein